MDFPIHSLIDEAAAETWVLNHFHPEGLCCPKCQASVSAARPFRKTATSGLQVYRCKHCESIYNLYSGTVFAQTQFRPSQVVLLLRGICQGVSSAQLSRELAISRQTVLSIRRKLHTSAVAIQPSATIEGVWTTVRNFLRPFRGIHKKFLSGYIAICEFVMNLKTVSVDFIAKLVKSTYF